MSADELKNKGNDAFKAKNYTDAIAWYTKAIELDPASESAGALYSNRSASWIGLQNYAKALEDAERCIRVRPSWLKGYFRKATSLENLARLDEAQKAYQEAMKCEPTNAEVQERLQIINTQIRARNETSTPNQCKTAEAAKVIGNSLFGQGKYESAAAFYTRAIELSASHSLPEQLKERANFFANRAACHQQTHSYSLVVDDCNAALLIEPNHVKALIRRAIAREGMEHWQRALDDYTLVNQLSPGMSNVSQGVLRCQRALRSL